MEKALDVLKDLCLVLNFNSYWKPRVEEAIAELEEAMKPKTCEWKNLEDDESYGWLSSCGCCYPHQKVWFQFCPMCGYKVIKNEPKDNA